jgi:peptidyl-tRNA hydrolase, PTH1 family
MKIIACLGNPGEKYRFTRHNIGALAGESLALHYGIQISRKGFSALYGTGKIGIHDIILLFPQTFMNLSGQSVSAALSFYKADENDLIVIHDEIELPFGDIRRKKGGGHKGHNGLRSIMQQIGSPDFQRLRFGVGRPSNEHIQVADHVLSEFSSDEKSRLESLYIRVREDIEGMLE